MKKQLLALYELAQDNGFADFVAALELAAEQQMYGAEYVRAFLAPPVPPAPDEAAHVRVNRLLACVPTQQNVERDLVQYERYVANRDRVLDPALVGSWGELVGRTAFIMAIIDRLLHHREVFYVRDSSYRMCGKEPVTMHAKGDGFPEAEKV
jgi:hypothetical protein